MPQVFLSARRFGKTHAAAQALGMSMDEYRELMRQQHERLESGRSLMPMPSPDRLSSEWWDRISRIGRPHVGHREFMREYLCEFDSPGPEPMGPPAPTFEQWERNQRRNAREAAFEPLPRWWRI